MQTNLYTSFNILKSSIKGMLEGELGSRKQGSSSQGQSAKGPQGQGGSIVFVSAAVASHGVPNYAAMSAAKAGVEGEKQSTGALVLAGALL